MEEKKRVIILVAIALILAATAIALNVMDSDEVPTSAPTTQETSDGGQVGVGIEPAPVEDKLTEETPQQ